MEPSPRGSTYFSTFMTCPTKFKYLFLEKLSPTVTSKALSIGEATHVGLQTWYTHTPESGEDRLDSAVQAAMEVLDARCTREDKSELMIYVCDLLAAYAVQYPKEDFEIIRAEIQSEIMISPGVTYSDRLDLLVRGYGKYLILEHKTTGQTFADFFRNFSSDLQLTGHVLVGKAICGVPVEGVIVNAIRKLESRFEFQREVFLRTQKQLDEFVELITFQHNEIESSKKGNRPFWKNLTQCIGKYGECPYRRLCVYGDNAEMRNAFYSVKGG